MSPMSSASPGSPKNALWVSKVKEKLATQLAPPQKKIKITSFGYLSLYNAFPYGMVGTQGWAAPTEHSLVLGN